MICFELHLDATPFGDIAFRRSDTFIELTTKRCFKPKRTLSFARAGPFSPSLAGEKRHLECDLLRTQLTAQQSSAAFECLSAFGGDFEGELRLALTCCYHAAIARSIIGSLTGVPWYYDEAELARMIDKTGGALSQMKTPGGCYEQTPAYVALRSRWKCELEKQQDTQIADAVFLLFQHSCVQYFERLGIVVFCKLIAGDREPHRVRDLLSVRIRRWIQEAMFIYRWQPGDATTISLQTIKARHPAAEQCEADSLAQVMSAYGRSALLFYYLSSGAKFDDQLK